MALALSDDVLHTLKMSEKEVLLELAGALYAAHKLSFGKAHELAGLDWYRFREVLANRGIPAHYDLEQLEEDMVHLELVA
ncbi:MAG: UPF0175 family protein [Saprospiraceae bacterium]|nr:UPF0175 family protein [Saprospiraceae bacterium]